MAVVVSILECRRAGARERLAVYADREQAMRRGELWLRDQGAAAAEWVRPQHEQLDVVTRIATVGLARSGAMATVVVSATVTTLEVL